MQHSNILHPGRLAGHTACARQFTILACALAAALAGGTAHARTRWQVRPVISGTPATTDTAGTAYSFRPTASGPSGLRLRFAIYGKPSWASFNSTTGQLSGTPTSANAGTSRSIVISVSDGFAAASLAPFTIKVSAATAAAPPPVSAPPSITGTPATTDTVGTAYAFTPQASDAGAALSFSVQNMPAWATFSIATGTLSGTPTAAGTYSNIVISVSNGSASAALAPFAITVNQPPPTSGSATLTWTTPVDNTNGSALTNLAGYHIYYGTSASGMSTVVDVASPGTTSYTVSNLASGTWYFAVNAYTTSGTESSLSNTGSKSIP